MNKLKENLFEVFLCLYSVRSFVVGPTLSDALIAVSLIISIVYAKSYLTKDKISDKEALDKELDAIKQSLAKLNLDNGIKRVGTNGFRS